MAQRHLVSSHLSLKATIAEVGFSPATRSSTMAESILAVLSTLVSVFDVFVSTEKPFFVAQLQPFATCRSGN
jgi:hypothetical protein